MIRTVDAQFVVTATRPEQYPKERINEIAFVGRSNVGKSSMINAVANRKKLVRVSNTPGRTRTLNFFDVTIERGPARSVIRLCDLPGYGFAKVGRVERESWQSMIDDYLTHRQLLRAVVTIIDGEIGPTADDISMIDFLQETRARILVVATKLDRVPKAKRKPQLISIATKLELPLEAVVGFSATERMGIEDVLERLVQVAG